MIKKQAKESLADKIAGVLSAVPAQFDPDDEHIDDTAAKLADFNGIDDDDEDDEALLSKFRKQNVDLLADVDTRYAGKKGSRRSLKDESSDEESEGEAEDSDDAEHDDEHSINKEDISSVDDEDHSDNASDDDQSGSEENSDEDSIALSEDESNFQHMSQANVSDQVKKGCCVRNQMNIWENVLEMRIQMQKALVAANKMPQKKNLMEMEKYSEATEFRKKVKETKDSLANVLNKLLILQNLVIKKYPETKKLGESDKGKTSAGNDSDEEIPSDTDEDIKDSESESDDAESEVVKTKRRKLNEYEQDISGLFEKYMNYRNDTIEKWNSKTRLSVTKNSGQTHSVVNQIEHILSDKDKLRKRTQLKRSEYRILGQDTTNNEALESNEDNGDVKPVEEYNTEIFDDTDFYHKLLRELIEVKSADITDPVQLGRQWIQLQNLRSKMKRKVDTRATKGRKIRYAVHTKLVNFMAPYENHSWTEEAKNELYSSLFGKIRPKQV